MRLRGLVQKPAGVSTVPCNPEQKVQFGGKAFSIFALITCVAALVVLSGCASSSSSSSSSSSLKLSLANGSQQNTVVGTAFGQKFSAVVTNNGSPVSGVTVTFSAPASGASGTFANGSASETDTTGSNGIATSSTFTANATAGSYVVGVSVQGVSASSGFSVTNEPAPVVAVNATNGSLQSVLVGTPFPTPLSAVVTQNGNPMSGVTVTFTAPPSSSASGTFANQSITETDTTDSNGIATSSTFTANSLSGAYTVSATVSGASAPATFSLTNLSTSVLNIVSVNGSQQSTKIGTPFSTQLEAGVFYSGVPVSGATVTFTAPSSGPSGTFSNGTNIESDVTDSNGHATSSAFTANATLGSYPVNATLSPNSTGATFTLVNLGPVGVFATAGTPQRAVVSSAFAQPLVATVVDQDGNPFSGISVTFAAPSSGASGTFSNHTTTETDTTDANGHATSSPFTANATANIIPLPVSYNVTATSGTLAPTNFILSNTKSGVTLTSYAFYLSGQEFINSSAGVNSYVLAGALTVDQNGLVTGGEQDYNDGFGLTSPQPSGDAITSGTLSVDATGQGMLTIATSNLNLGVGGVEVFAVQFVNASHALILQFDGSATSSGSLDVQNLSAAPSNGYAFAISGATSVPFAMGGVFAFGGNLLNPIWLGTSDTNFGGTVTTNSPVATQLGAVDLYGRGQMNGLVLGGVPLTLNYYQVGPEALRIVGVDSATVAVGSAFGQGPIPTNFSAAGLGTSVFSILGNPHSNKFGVLGQFTTNTSNPSLATLTGIADDNELGNPPVSAAAISGNYTVAASGYGNVNMAAGPLGNVSQLGLYLTDPNLNLNDPNNTSGGGGALLLDLDASLAGGTGFVTPQTDTSTASFTGNYVAGWQYFDLTGAYCCEVDTAAVGTVSTGTLNLLGLISDPFQTLTSNTTTPGDTFIGTPLSDTNHSGRSTMLSTNATPNPLTVTVTIVPKTFNYDVVVYQASGKQLFWLDVDSTDVFSGPIEQQGSLTGIPAVKKRISGVQTR